MDTINNLRRHHEGKGKKEEIITADMGPMKVIVKAGQLREHILQHISENVILDIITPMLSWMESRLLFSASPTGQKAIESRLVYNTRLRTHSTESLAIFTQTSRSSSRAGGESASLYRKTLFAYSRRNKFPYELPSIPGCSEGIPPGFQAQSVDGKLYILGGLIAQASFDGRKEVFVLDLAGRMQWKKCASMGESRTQFASAVMKGKIYVFGGTDYEHKSLRCEVYDPKADAWTWIKPMAAFHRGHQVATAGDEMFIYYKGYHSAVVAEVYHTVNDEWRTIRLYKFPPLDAFPVHGRFLHITAFTEVDGDIQDRDIDGEFSRTLQSCSYPKSEETDFSHESRGIGNGLAVGDELLVLQSGWDCPGRLLQSIGFGQENTKLVWSETMKVEYDCCLLCSVEL